MTRAAIVTGAANGIGLATARAFAAAGAAVLLVDLADAEAEAAALRAAVDDDPRMTGVPSTKGAL